jgi:hypothetical protein
MVGVDDNGGLGETARVNLLVEAQAEADAELGSMLAALTEKGWRAERFLIPVKCRMRWDTGSKKSPDQTGSAVSLPSAQQRPAPGKS